MRAADHGPKAGQQLASAEGLGKVVVRTDSQARDYPEFTDDKGRSTNSSGGGLFRAGLTFYW